MSSSVCIHFASVQTFHFQLGLYPVDILDDDPEGHREAALAYYATLRGGAPPPAAALSLPAGEQVNLEAASVCLCTLHRDEPRHKILVLVSPQDTKTVVAVYVKESWWATEDALRTSDPAREGLMEVQTFGERIVLFLLNVVIFGRLERKLDDDDMFFLPHSVREQAKILWRDGAAVGFYTTKRKGSLCGDGTGACYLLPVLDTVFVRRGHRRQGLGMAMLQDFCGTFRDEEALGVSWPISPAMYQGQTPRPRVGVRGTWMSLLPGVWMRPGWCPACCCCWSTGRDAGWWPMSSLTFPSERTAPAEPLPAKRSPI
ncbi:protein FAM169B-like isoform 5-T5 [Molossus nigricans]